MAKFASGRLAITLAALFFSGVAGIINQVVWQRALKISLGGSETLSSLVVVLVFMLGLGIGAGIVGRRAGRITHPLRAFAWIEIGLFVLNTAIALVLALNLSETIYAAQRLAISAGAPLRLIYACGALCILLPPTILMGATLPVASEACQKQFRATHSTLIPVLFFLNTIGAVAGAFGGSFYLLPYLGQRSALLIAAGFNLAAGLALSIIALRTPAVENQMTGRVGAEQRSERSRRPITVEETLGAALGFTSLGYEMYLFRLMPLAHEPLPYTFAFTLCFFLLFWSAGVYASGWIRGRLHIAILTGAAAVAIMPLIYAYDRWQAKFLMFAGGLIYFAPCVFFGFLYGALISRFARDWGRDVGRFYALNTLGSCLGILFFTLVGYEIRHDYNAILIALSLVAIFFQLMLSDARAAGHIREIRRHRLAQSAVGLFAVGLLAVGLASSHSVIHGAKTFWGRDGVVEVHPSGDVFIDGLWHSRLSDGQDHIGSKYSWDLVAAAVLSHQDEPIRDALVVGNGIGITAATLAKIGGIHVDAYEINHTLRAILREYPKGSLGVAELPNIEIRWQDGRSGMALDLKKYDLIISAPLYFRQAGSSILLSREYMELVRSRLKENGVFAFLSREGGPPQSRLTQTTVRSVFRYVKTFKKGLLSTASDFPIKITPEEISKRLARKDPFYREMARQDRKLRKEGTAKGLYGLFDAGRSGLAPSPYAITDDHPLIEYPNVTQKLLGRGKGLKKGNQHIHHDH
jgi:spermidine synthase